MILMNEDMSHLNGMYNKGYTKALLDVKNFFEYHSDSIKYNKLYKYNGIMAILSALLEYRDELRDMGSIEDLIIKKDKDSITLIKKAR